MAPAAFSGTAGFLVGFVWGKIKTKQRLKYDSEAVGVRPIILSLSFPRDCHNLKKSDSISVSLFPLASKGIPDFLYSAFPWCIGQSNASLLSQPKTTKLMEMLKRSIAYPPLKVIRPNEDLTRKKSLFNFYDLREKVVRYPYSLLNFLRKVRHIIKNRDWPGPINIIAITISM